MHTMDRDEWRTFLLTGTRTGKLAVTGKNGSPHVVPVWFLLDTDGEDDYVVFNTGADTVKGRALARDPRFSMCVDVDEPPFSYVSVHCTAEISQDLAPMLVWATRLGARYMGADRAQEYGRRNAVPGELLVRGRITKVHAIADVAE